MKVIDLNCDMGESFGIYKMGFDEEIMPFIDMANLACGFHASDPVTMHKSIKNAKEQGVEIGCHPSYPDLVGFGRREMSCSEEEIVSFILYQLGALDALCQSYGQKVTYLKPHGALKHFMLEGTGSNFELLTNIIQALNGDHDLMFYARYDPPDYNRVDAVLSETMKFYANHMMTLHRVNSSKSEHIIKQICFECTSPEVLEKGLINYWLRAHLTGGYTCIVVPYDNDFIKKATACESSYEADLDIEEIIGSASWLFKTESLTGTHDNLHDFYTSWDVARLKKKIATVHPVS